MAIFGNASQGPPVDAVNQLRSQNRSDHDIIDELSRQGYSSIDIYNALNAADGADAPSEANAQPEQPMQPPAQASAQPSGDQSTSAQPAGQPGPDPFGPSPSSDAPDPWSSSESDPWNAPAPGPEAPLAPGPEAPQGPPSAPQPQAPPQQAPAPPAPPQRSPPQASTFGPAEQHASAPTFRGSDASIDQIDQVAEAIIDEKWKQMKSYIEKIIDWKGKVENRIIAIEENQKTINEQIVGLQKSMLDKVQTYDRHITDVGTEIKAMEKVFQKIIPTLTDNVNELSNVVHRMKDDQ